LDRAVIRSRSGGPYLRGCALALLALFLITFSRAYLMFSLGLSEDECYYWEWSRNLAPAFYDQGPGVALAIRSGTLLFGDTVLGVRFPALVLGVGTLVVAYRLGVMVHGSKRSGLLSMLLVALTPLNYFVSLGMIHDVVMLACWALCVYFFVCYLRTERSRHFYLCAIALGLGLLTKHTMILMVPSVFLFLLLQPRYRFVLESPHFWCSTALVVGICLPLVYWNLVHDWAGLMAVIHLPSSNPHEAASYVLLGSYVLVQLLAYNPIALIAMMPSVWRHLARSTSDPAKCFLACSVAVMAIFFLLLSTFRTVQANWPICCYFGGFVLLAGVLADALRRHRPFLPFALIAVSITVVASVVFPAPVLHLSRILGLAIDPSDLPTNQLAAGPQVAEALEAVRTQYPNAMLSANRYQVAAQMAFYLEGQPRVYCFNINSRPNQYEFWESPNAYLGRDFIFVDYADHPPAQPIVNLFESLALIQSGNVGVLIRDYRELYDN